MDFAARHQGDQWQHVQQQQQASFMNESLPMGLLPVSEFAANHLLARMRSLEETLDFYATDVWTSTGDERSNRLPLMGAGPWKLLWATCLYLWLIKSFVPRVMKPLAALELNWPIRAYNFLMVLANGWYFYEGARILQLGRKCFGCEIIDQRDNSPQAIELLHYGWLFFISRIFEWLDTLFFVLRKRHRQVTKLHVFHHSFVPLFSWIYLKYHPGFNEAFFPWINSFVHTIMYSYYFLATFGPAMQPYLWWKRHLTSLQIFQFVLILVQLASVPLAGDARCEYPRGFLYVAFAGASLFLWLFFTYYMDTYRKPSKQISCTSQRRANMERLSPHGRVSPFEREGSTSSLPDLIEDAINTSAAGAESHLETSHKLD